MPTYLITGANRGIGLELARQLAARGDRVIATARHPEDADELNALDVRVEALDVADDASVAALAARLEGEPIDVLVNNAGVGHTAKSIADVQPTEMLRVFHVNAVGPLMVTRALLPNLEAGDRKLVVSISSVMGSIASTQGTGHYAYRTSKAALNMVNRTMANELKHLTCVVMHPGWVKTDMGGAEAPVEIPDSARGIITTTDTLTPKDTARYLDYQGNDLPW